MRPEHPMEESVQKFSTAYEDGEDGKRHVGIRGATQRLNAAVQVLNGLSRS